MEIARRQYYSILFIFMLILCALCTGLSVWSINNAELVYAEQTHNQIYAIKKSFLKDTVQNIIQDMNQLRIFFSEQGRKKLRRLEPSLNMYNRLSPDAFPDFVSGLMANDEYANSLNLRLTDMRSNTTVLDIGEISRPQNKRFQEMRLYDRFRVDIGINRQFVDSQTKLAVAKIIHNKHFENDAYIWVNEVHNFNGGDNYAIRRIHPNLRSTEGSFLSTSMKDIKGNTPYLTELEGVKKTGEIFFTYFFKRKNSEEIAEKLTYATIYRDYNWIVSMGVYLPDVNKYIGVAKKESSALVTRLITVSIIIIFFIFASGIYVLSNLERWHTRHTIRMMREESNKDLLTGAFNRRVGDVYLKEAFRRFRMNEITPVFVMYDIDDFKSVNDRYGHDVGDKVLKTVVEKTLMTMRRSDYLFRWGGEEFLLICEGINYSNITTFANKLNNIVAAEEIHINSAENETVMATIHVTISIGISSFDKNDLTHEDAIKRADQAMYRAKSEGKNCARLSIKE